MKKVYYSIIMILTFIFLPSFANAANVSVSVTCKDVTVNQTTTCTLKGTTSGKVAGLHAAYTISSGATIQSFKQASHWNGGGGDEQSFDIQSDKDATGTFDIGTLTIKGTKVGNVTITVRDVVATDPDFNEANGSGTSKTFKVLAVATKAPTTSKTTKSTTKTSSTKKTTTTNKNNTTTNPNDMTQRPTTSTISRPTMAIQDMVLTNVKVDDFNVTFENGIYRATVNANTEKVTISATAPAGVTVIGSGQRNLAVGDNSVDLVLRDQGGQTVTYQLIITRPEGAVISDTKLTSLRVVGYEFAFNPNTQEYTVTVPSNINEVYVEAKSYSDDVIISGAGLQTLNKGKNDIYIRVSYGELANTEYKITIKRSYMSTILWVIIGFLGAGLIGMAVYANINRKAAVSKVVAEKNKQIAQNNRAAVANNPQVQLNGESVVGTGKQTVAPTPVKTVTPVAPQNGVPTTPVAPVAPVAQTVKVAPATPGAQTTPVVKTVQAKPNVVQAQGTPAPAKDPKMIQTAPPAQVKVVKTTVVPVKQPSTQIVNTNSAPTPNVLPVNDNKPVI